MPVKASGNETRLTPLKAIRAKCLECTGYEPSEVRKCSEKDACFLWPFRFGRRPATRGLSPLKAIRRECLRCMGESCQLVAECDSRFCHLVPYRFGKNPRRRGIGGPGRPENFPKKEAELQIAKAEQMISPTEGLPHEGGVYSSEQEAKSQPKMMQALSAK